MRTHDHLTRFLAAVVITASFLGAAQPSTGAQAASPRQEGTGGNTVWGEYTMQPSARGRLATMTEPPAFSPRASIAADAPSGSSRMPGPPTRPGQGQLMSAQQTMSAETSVGVTAEEALSTFTVFSNDALVGATNVENTAVAVEPSAANNGKVVFASYNFYAARSIDYGSTWTYIDPTQVSTDFCCDQEVIYDPSHDLTFWLLMDNPFYDLDEIPPGINDNNDGNVLHLVVFVGSTDLVLLDYVQYPIDPVHNCTGGTDEDWFDFPHMALTSSYLYITANVYRKPSDVYQCTTAMRFSLDEVLVSINAEYFSSDDTLFNFAPAHGGTDIFYFATHDDADTLLVYDWPESVGSGSVDVTSIEHDAYLSPLSVGYAGYDCTPGGTPTNPCGNEDDRIMAGSLRRDTHELSFMWDAPQGLDAQGDFDWPRIRYVMLDATSGTPATTPLEDDSIYNNDFAWFLPAASANARGHVGGMAAFSGGVDPNPIYPGCAAWLYDDYSTSFLPLEAMEVTTALGNPDGDRWGDYYGARMSGLNPFQWIGSCYAVELSGINPHVVRFGRERDTFLPRKSDFDGDNKSDPVKFADTGLAWWFKSSTSVWDSANLGTDGTETYVRRSDFDGDGRADAAKYDPATGVIWYIGSRSGLMNGVYVGDDGVPMGGSDFDRDGKTDPAKYVGGPPGDGRGAIWYIKSSNGAWQGSFIGYDAAPALSGSDYDGDGKTDVAKYLSDGAIWYIESSTGTWQGFYIGNDGTPITGSDFDADGKTDAAKFVASVNCIWYIASSTGLWNGAYLGEQPFDYIQASDFDGDAMSDPAKFDPGSQTVWWLKSSTGLWDAVWMGTDAYTVEN